MTRNLAARILCCVPQNIARVIVATDAVINDENMTLIAVKSCLLLKEGQIGDREVEQNFPRALHYFNTLNMAALNEVFSPAYTARQRTHRAKPLRDSSLFPVFAEKSHW